MEGGEVSKGLEGGREEEEEGDMKGRRVSVRQQLGGPRVTVWVYSLGRIAVSRPIGRAEARIL